MFTIYAMRAKGEIEVRYIGQTTKTPETRVKFETGMARSFERARWRTKPVEGMYRWLLDNEVEGVVLATAATRPEANAKEREMVVLFAKLGHRLFNRWLVPAELRRAA